MTDDPPSTAAIADALDVDEATLQRCLSQHRELALAHIVAFTDAPLDEIREIGRDAPEAVAEDAAAWREHVVDHSRTGYLIDVGGGACERLKLLRCPACGERFVEFWDQRAADPLRRHLDAAHGPEDFPNPAVPSDVFYTRAPSAYGRDAEGTQQHNHLRKEPRLPGTPFQGETGWEPASPGAPYTVLCEARTKAFASPEERRERSVRATSSRRRASTALK